MLYYVDAWSRSVWASVCQPFVTAVDFPLKFVQYSGTDLRALRSTNQLRHVVNDAVAGGVHYKKHRGRAAPTFTV